VASLLGPSGPFVQKLPRYEAREGQERVAAAVEEVLAQDGILLCEAGTGIGKTFAYLVPALLSGRKVIISTATKTLQDQIAERDLPLVQEVLGTNVSAVVMKGLSNYLCRRRYKQFLLSTEGARPEALRELGQVAHFLKTTHSGDLSELATLREESRVRLEVSSSSDTRLGPRCPEYDACFVTEMRKAADQAQIVIVNHHLFFADLALRGPHPGRVLPEYDAVIFDEAHQIEDVAAQFFGARISEGQLHRLLGELGRALAKRSAFQGPLDRDAGLSLVERAARTVSDIFAELFDKEAGAARRPTLRSDALNEALKRSLPELEVRLRDVQVSVEARRMRQDNKELSDEFEAFERRIDGAITTVRGMLSPHANSVVWLDAPARALCLTPVDLAPLLSERLFDAVPTVGLLSATLSTQGKTSPDKSPFAFFRARLGVPKSSVVRELNVPSPFDYRQNCLFYVAKDLGEVSESGFLARAAERAIQLMRASNGGAFFLTTSLASVNYYAGHLRKVRLPWPIFVQGERPKEALLAAFRAAGNAILIATSSFWEGVDVPGPALRLLILEKIPFQVPTDPVYEARSRSIEARGGSPFGELALPDAAITLKQGFGRLLRSGTDRGVVALLDRRLVERPYGKRLLRALPDVRVTVDTLEACRRLHELRLEGYEGEQELARLLLEEEPLPGALSFGPAL